MKTKIILFLIPIILILNLISAASSQGNYTNTLISTITVGTEPFSVAFNPSGTLTYVSNYGSNTVSVINTATNSVINTITVGTQPYSVAFNPSGTLLKLDLDLQ